MLDSVRARLTMWYTLVLGVVLAILAVSTYFLYLHNSVQRTDSNIREISEAFVTTFNAELEGQSGTDAVKNAAREAMLEHRFRGTFFALADAGGNVIQSSVDLPRTESSKELLHEGFFSTEAFRSTVTRTSISGELQTIRPEGLRDRFRTLARPLSAGGSSFILVVVQSLHPQREMMEDIRNTFLWAIPLSLFLASLGGYFLARRSLAPVAAMASEARGMGAANLQRRLPIANERDELGQLALTFNQLLDRLEASFEQQRRFMADASHELRTPVAILRGETEVTLSQNERTPAEYRETLSILRDESQRLARIIEDLFILARADAGQYPLTLRDAYLDEIAGEALVRARSLAQSKQITLTSSIEPELPINADEALLARMLLNLLDNAIKYSPAGSSVNLSCRRDGGQYLVSVSDQGPGIPAEMRALVFDRFFRVDKARSRAEGEIAGAGLGLSIARWIAEAHHGRLELASSNGLGATFAAFLPTGPVG
jgi:two-component system, OmpR family, sensor kinase